MGTVEYVVSAIVIFLLANIAASVSRIATSLENARMVTVQVEHDRPRAGTPGSSLN